MKVFGSLRELVATVFRKDTKEITLQPNSTSYSSVSSPVVELPPPASGTTVLVGALTAQTLEQKTIDGDDNTLSNIGILSLKAEILDADKVLVRDVSGVVTSAKIADGNVDAGAAISYSKLALAGSIVEGDFATSLPDANDVLLRNSSGVVTSAKITDDNIDAAAAIAYSKLALSSSIQGSDLVNDISLPGLAYGSPQNATLVSNTLSPTTGKIIHRLTSGATLDMIDSPTAGRVLVLVNASGADITVNNATGGTAANQIITGTGDAFTLASGAAATVAYNSTDAKWSLVGGGGGSGGGTVDNITQATSFVVGDVIYLNGSTYAKANAGAANTAEVVGIISKVVLAGQKYQLLLAGEVSGLLAANFTEAALPAAGEAIFLSTTDGKMSINPPTVLGQVAAPLGVSLGSGSMYFFPRLGSVVGGTNARTELNLLNVTTSQPIQPVAVYPAGELTGWVTISATTPRRFYLAAQFSQNGAGTNYNISYQTSGDVPPTGFAVTITSGGTIELTLTSSPLAGFTSAKINFALNAPAVGATFPLAVDASTITTGVVSASRLPVVVPGTSAGVVAAAGLPGNTTGSAIAAGYVGQTTPRAEYNNAAVGITTVNLGTLNLTAGVWLVLVSGNIYASTDGRRAAVSISLTSATEDTAFDTVATAGTANGGNVLSQFRVLNTSAANTPVYVTGRGPDGTVSMVVDVQAIRIA